jgi:hypothetical protein
MAQQTAVSWLVNQINGHSHSIGLPYGMNIRIDIPDDIIEQAKQKEKEQMHKCASFWRGKENEIEKPMFDEYYNETYNK